jgi:competence protein ComEC
VLIDFPQTQKAAYLQPEEIYAGRTISFKGNVVLTEKPRNPGAFDYPAYLAAQQIYCRVQADLGAIKLGKETGHIYHWLHNLRQSLKKEIKKYLPPEEAAIVEGCLLGSTKSINDHDLFVYQQVGIAHLFAVSGSHGSMIFAIAAFCSAFFPGKRIIWSRWLLSMGLLCFYAALTGFPISMLRTFIMGLIVRTAEVAGRKSDPFTALSTAFLILLWQNPGCLQQAGFQLSFGVVLGLLRLGPWLTKRGWPDWLRIPVAAQLAGMPLQAFWFNQWQPLSAIINMVEMIIMAPLMVLSLCAAFIAQCGSMLAAGLWRVCGFLAWTMHQAAIVWMRLPWACWPVAQRSWPVYIMWGLALWLLPEVKYYYLAFNSWFLHSKMGKLLKKKLSYKGSYKSSNKSRKVLLSLLICVVLIKGSCQAPLEVVFLDVGEGDCAVIHTPKGKTWLIDGGGTTFSDYETGTEIILPYLYHKGVRRIEGIFLSHHHQDHREGLTELLSWMPAKSLWMPPLSEAEGVDAYADTDVNGDADAYADTDAEFIRILAQRVKQVNTINTGEVIVQLEKGLKVKIWWPYALAEEKGSICNSNDRSLVFKLSQNERCSWLFAGDLELQGLKTLLDKATLEELSSTVLKLPHHGSSTSYWPDFYLAVKPAGVVATGGRNKSGNLAEEIRQWFQNQEVPLWSTRQNGAIITTERKDRIVVRTVIP